MAANNTIYLNVRIIEDDLPPELDLYYFASWSRNESVFRPAQQATGREEERKRPLVLTRRPHYRAHAAL